MKITIINGPNLNMLGKREPEIYGSLSFDDYLEDLKSQFANHCISYFQDNVEGEIINAIHDANNNSDAIILNAGAYTHTSVAIGDAIKAIGIPVIEVHISNVFSREAFRHISYLAPHCKGSIIGLGLDGYRLALSHLVQTS